MFLDSPVVRIQIYFLAVPFDVVGRSGQQTQSMLSAQLKISEDAPPLKQEWQRVRQIEDNITAGKESQKPFTEPSFFYG
jgi:hypothetical protein